jgi:hypothetical protein
MALVKKLRPLRLTVNAKHAVTEATYSLVREQSGELRLQIDTYGSKDRRIKGKKSQSIRLICHTCYKRPY